MAFFGHAVCDPFWQHFQLKWHHSAERLCYTAHRRFLFELPPSSLNTMCIILNFIFFSINMGIFISFSRTQTRHDRSRVPFLKWNKAHILWCDYVSGAKWDLCFLAGVRWTWRNRCVTIWRTTLCLCNGDSRYISVCLGYWSTDGCITSYNGTEYICSCNHLSFFAVLVVSSSSSSSRMSWQHFLCIIKSRIAFETLKGLIFLSEKRDTCESWLIWFHSLLEIVSLNDNVYRRFISNLKMVVAKL